MKVQRPPRPGSTGATKALERKPAPAAKAPAPSGWTAARRTRPAPVPPPPLDPRRPGTTGLDLIASTGPRATGPEVVRGVTLSPHGCAQAAMDEAKRVVELVARRPDIAEAMRREKVTMVIIPSDTRMVDLPEFASLKGTSTFDGRLWDDVRGSGGLRADGRLYVGVAEENLAHLSSSAYAPGYSIGMHELAHAVHQYALPRAEREAITTAYEARKTAGGPWTETYGASNELEYFAQGTNAWFGQNVAIGNNGADWVRTNDPALATVLEKVYGAPPGPPVS